MVCLVLIRSNEKFRNFSIFKLWYTVILTLCAGKLTPAAKVEVQQITHITPVLKPSSINFLSSLVNPVIIITLLNSEIFDNYR